MVLGIGVHGDVALVEVCNLGLSGYRTLGDEDGDRRTLRLIVLLGDIEHGGTDHVGEVCQDGGQTLGVVLLIDVSDVVLLFALGFRVADIVDVETQGFGQVVESVKL